MQEAGKQYKVVLVGDGGAGKTTFLKRHRTGEFEKKYLATIGVEVHLLSFMTNYGPISFSVWDTAGQEKFGGLRDGYYWRSDAAIIMFDLTNDDSVQKNFEKWQTSLKRIISNVPIVGCGNKFDLLNESSLSANISTAKYYCDDLYLISAKTNYNYDKPFLSLARKLTGHSDLVFTPLPKEEEDINRLGCPIESIQKMQNKLISVLTNAVFDVSDCLNSELMSKKQEIIDISLLMSIIRDQQALLFELFKSS